MACGNAGPVQTAPCRGHIDARQHDRVYHLRIRDRIKLRGNEGQGL